MLWPTLHSVDRASASQSAGRVLGSLWSARAIRFAAKPRAGSRTARTTCPLTLSTRSSAPHPHEISRVLRLSRCCDLKRVSRGSASSDDLARACRNRCCHRYPLAFSSPRIASSGGLFAAVRLWSAPQPASPIGRRSVAALAEVAAIEAEAAAAYGFSLQHPSIISLNERAAITLRSGRTITVEQEARQITLMIFL